MRLLGTIFAVLFALIAVPLFMAAACNAALMASYLNRTTYDSLLENEAIFEDMITVALPAIFAVSEKENTPIVEDSPIRVGEIIRALQPETWEEVANLIVSPQWLQETTTQLVDVLFAIVDGDMEAIEQEVSLADVRQRLLGAEAIEAANLIITEAPECNQTQLDQLRRFIASQEGNSLPICNPSDLSLQAQSIQFLTIWFGVIGEELGADTVTVAQLFDLNRNSARGLYLLVEIDRQALVLLYLCPMALIALIVIFTVRSFKGFGRWLGVISIAVGGVILLQIFGLQVLLFNIVAEVLQAETEAEEFFSRLFVELLRSASAQGSSSLLLQAGVFIAIGFILLAIAWFRGRGEHDDDDADMVIITDDGQIISTATQKRLGTVAQPKEEV